MEIKVDKLKKFLLIANKVIPRNSTLPILKEILVRDGYFMVTNLENFLFYPVGKSTAFTIPFGDLREFVKGAKGEIEILKKEKNRVEIKKSSLSVTFQGKDPNDFPGMMEKQQKKAIVLKAGILTELKMQIPLLSDDVLRPALCGVLLKLEDPVVSVATNGHLLREITHADKSKVKRNIIIPKTVVEIITRDVNDPVTLSLGKTVARFEWKDGRKLYTRITDDKYPDYKSVLPSVKGMRRAKMNRDKLLSILSEFKSLTEKDRNEIHLDVHGNKLVISVENVLDDRYASTELKAKSNLNGKVFSVAFNVEYLERVIKATTGKKVTYLFDEPLKASYWFGEEKNSKTLLMPIRRAEVTKY